MLASRALLQMREQLQKPKTATDFMPSSVRFVHQTKNTESDTMVISEVERQPGNSKLTTQLKETSLNQQ